MTGLVLIRRSTVEELLVVCRSTVCELSVENLPIDGRQILGEAVHADRGTNISCKTSCILSF